MTSSPHFNAWQRRFFTLGWVVCWVIFSTITLSVWAQERPYITSLYVALWPEYDDPRVLVILSGTLSIAEQEVSLPIPARAELNAVAYVGDDGRLLRAQYSFQERDERVLRLQVPTNRFHVEYYVDAIRQEGEETVVHVRIPLPLLEIRKGVLEVQQPAHTKGFHANPPLNPPKEGFGGLLYASRPLEALAPGTIIEQEVRYVRTQPGLSTTPRAPVTPLPSSSGTSFTPVQSSGSSHPWGPIGLGVALALVLGGSLFWWMRHQGGTPGSALSSVSRKAQHKRPVGPSTRPLPKYCPNCGHPFGPNDKYCVMCGTKRE